MAVDTSIRVPLDETTNESGSPPPSPPLATIKTGPALRRKPTHHVLHPNLDSSESYPSPHSSIYEASLVHQSSTEQLKHNGKEDCIPSYRTDEGLPSWSHIVPDASGNPVPFSFLQAPPTENTHMPHELYPITERSSLSTLKASLSLKGQMSSSTLRPHSPGLNGKKRKSFSFSDLPPTPERRTSSPPSPLPAPARPHLLPPVRIPTPPGLPTFGKPEAINYRLPSPKARFRDKFRPLTPAEQEYNRQTVGLPRGVVMRGDNGVMVRGKFTPIVSGHFPPQNQVHRFFRAPNQADLAVPEPTEQRAAAGGGMDPADCASENVPRPRVGCEPHKKSIKKEQQWARNACEILFCCGILRWLDEDQIPDSPATITNSRNVVQRDVQPRNMRPRITVPPASSNFQGRGYTLH